MCAFYLQSFNSVGEERAYKGSNPANSFSGTSRGQSKGINTKGIKAH